MPDKPTSKEVLKPCPFCGSKASANTRVVCLRCNAMMTDCHNARGQGIDFCEDYTELNQEEVIKAWNRRTP